MAACAKALAAGGLAAVALSLQGCFMGPFPMSVKIVIAQRCHEKAEELSTDKELDAFHSKACGAMSVHKLKAFELRDSCEELVENVVHKMVSTECGFVVGYQAREACGGGRRGGKGRGRHGKTGKHKEGCVCPEIWQPVCGGDEKTYSNDCAAGCSEVDIQCEGECPCKEERRLGGRHGDKSHGGGQHEGAPFDAEACKAAIDDAVGEFEPEGLSEIASQDEDEMVKEMEDSMPEAVLALAAQCRIAMEALVSEKSGQRKRLAEDACGKTTNATRMQTMGVSDKQCADFFVNMSVDWGTSVCIGVALDREDLPDHPDLGDIKRVAGDFRKEVQDTVQNIDDSMQLVDKLMEEVMPMGESQMEPEAALRLFHTGSVRKLRWPTRASERARKLPFVTAAAASCVAAALALLAAAWRLRPSRREAGADAEPLVEKETEEVELR